jgi:predicted RNase H-like HicB family nuclease
VTIRYHVTVTRQGDEWRAVCPALRQHGADIGGETREEALTHIDNAIQMILAQMQTDGIPPPPDETVPNSVVLTFAAEGDAE